MVIDCDCALRPAPDLSAAQSDAADSRPTIGGGAYLWQSSMLYEAEHHERSPCRPRVLAGLLSSSRQPTPRGVRKWLHAPRLFCIFTTRLEIVSVYQFRQSHSYGTSKPLNV